MAFVTACVDVWNASGASIIQATGPNATRSPIVLQVGTGLTASFTQSGDLGLVALAAGGAGTFADITLPPEAQPAAPSSGWKLYVDSVDGQLKAEDSAGNVIVMSTVRTTKTTKTLTANNTTAHVALFQVSGVIRMVKLYGVVTTTLGANHTAAQFTIYDQTTRNPLTAASGAPTASGYTPGSTVGALGLPSSAAIFESAAAAFSGASSANQMVFQELIVGAKTGVVVSQIEYTYATTDTPTSGAIQFFIQWEPLSVGATVTAL